MFFSESRYADNQPPKLHGGPIFGMIGTQSFGAGRSLDLMPNIGPAGTLEIIAAFRKKHDRLKLFAFLLRRQTSPPPGGKGFRRRDRHKGFLHPLYPGSPQF